MNSVRQSLLTGPISHVDREEPFDDRDGDFGHWGDRLAEKSVNCLRVAFQNINGLASTSGEKDYSIGDFLRDHQVDVIGLAELNVNWSAVLDEHRFHRRFIGWFDNCKAVCAHNLRVP